MKNAGLIVVGALVTIKVVTAYHIIRSIKKEGEEARAQIQLNLQDDLSALNTAKGIVLERMRQGGYDGKTYQDVLNDLRFETIIQREQ